MDVKQDEEELQLYANETMIYDVATYDYLRLDFLFVSLIPIAWGEVLYNHTNELNDAGMVLTKLIQKKQQRLVPHPWNVFRSLALTPPALVKVVIIGQDPYFIVRNGIPSATGLCFECAKGQPIEKSLGNILTVMSTSNQGFKLPNDEYGNVNGELIKWAEQGVLLLNAALTTAEGVANAHADIWEFFPKRILEYITKTRKNVVYMLWGRFAQKFESILDKNDNLILIASHPVARGNGNTFVTCNHFNEANDYLKRNEVEPINWQL